MCPEGTQKQAPREIGHAQESSRPGNQTPGKPDARETRRPGDQTPGRPDAREIRRLWRRALEEVGTQGDMHSGRYALREVGARAHHVSCKDAALDNRDAALDKTQALGLAFEGRVLG